MNFYKPDNISNFFVAGINYKKTDAATRGKFAINTDQYQEILRLAHSYQVESLFILSTCNRTEIYGFAPSATNLTALLCSQTSNTASAFTALAYIKNADDAITHLFEVAAGLDSQILGDYEIVGQLKQAVKFSKDRGLLNCFLERLFNAALQSAKTIKNHTALSDGTVSASFAAVQYIKAEVQNIADKRVLVVGTGKMGRNTCKNLIDYLGTTNITLINRTDEKAAVMAADLNLQCAPYNQLHNFVDNADVILVATNAASPILYKAGLENKGTKLIIDLSIPNNVEDAVRELPNISLLNVDELSKMKDATLQKRLSEIPKAKEIIAEHISQFNDWYQMHRNATVLQQIKLKLGQISTCNTMSDIAGQNLCTHGNDKIQTVVKRTANKMRIQSLPGCHFIEAINDFMGAGLN